MASELRVNTLKDASGNNSIGVSYVAEGSAKAWQNLKGTSTISTRDSFNVASTTDFSTGRYRPNFTNAMNNSTYVVTTNGHRAEDHAIGCRESEKTTSLYEIMVHNHLNTTDTDSDSVFSLAHGDLA
jgi:hypothetical protein